MHVCTTFTWKRCRRVHWVRSVCCSRLVKPQHTNTIKISAQPISKGKKQFNVLWWKICDFHNFGVALFVGHAWSCRRNVNINNGSNSFPRTYVIENKIKCMRLDMERWWCPFVYIDMSSYAYKAHNNSTTSNTKQQQTQFTHLRWGCELHKTTNVRRS